MASEQSEVKLKDKFMLTLKEAAVYFSVGEKRLRRMAEDNEGSFCFYYGHKWLFIRTKLEDYFLAKAQNEPELNKEPEIEE